MLVMGNGKHEKFAAEVMDVVKALMNPLAWPALDKKFDRLVESLASQPEWSIAYEDPLANKGASAAESVIKDGRTQSYVSRGYPSWLEHIFMRELLEI